MTSELLEQIYEDIYQHRCDKNQLWLKYHPDKGLFKSEDFVFVQNCWKKLSEKNPLWKKCVKSKTDVQNLLNGSSQPSVSPPSFYQDCFSSFSSSSSSLNKQSFTQDAKTVNDLINHFFDANLKKTSNKKTNIRKRPNVTVDKKKKKTKVNERDSPSSVPPILSEFLGIKVSTIIDRLYFLLAKFSGSSSFNFFKSTSNQIIYNELNLEHWCKVWSAGVFYSIHCIKLGLTLKKLTEPTKAQLKGGNVTRTINWEEIMSIYFSKLMPTKNFETVSEWIEFLVH
jgi:hypothetical protein